jgi:hypothetical protein
LTFPRQITSSAHHMMTPFILILLLVACAATASRAGTASDTSFPKIISCSLQRPIITINNDEEIEGGGFVQSQQQQSDINISEGSTSTTQETTPNAVSSNGMWPPQSHIIVTLVTSLLEMQKQLVVSLEKLHFLYTWSLTLASM